jgi:hypothetical protein
MSIIGRNLRDLLLSRLSKQFFVCFTLLIISFRPGNIVGFWNIPIQPINLQLLPLSVGDDVSAQIHLDFYYRYKQVVIEGRSLSKNKNPLQTENAQSRR